MAWNNNAGNFSSITDNKSNTYTQIGAATAIAGTGGSYLTRLYYCENATGGSSHQVTVTLSAAALLTIFLVEITGGATSSSLDQHAETLDFSSPYSSGATATTTNAADLLVSMYFGSSVSNPATHAQSGGTPSSGWTLQTNAEETNGSNRITGCTMTQIVAATGAYDGSWTESGSSGAAIYVAAFKELVAASGQPYAKRLGGIPGMARNKGIW
jgi:hypothetical protein